MTFKTLSLLNKSTELKVVHMKWNQIQSHNNGVAAAAASIYEDILFCVLSVAMYL